MWRNFRFLHICHTYKFDISPHDKFFSTYLICEICEKYQVCLQIYEVYNPAINSILYSQNLFKHLWHKVLLKFLSLSLLTLQPLLLSTVLTLSLLLLQCSICLLSLIWGPLPHFLGLIFFVIFYGSLFTGLLSFHYHSFASFCFPNYPLL